MKNKETLEIYLKNKGISHEFLKFQDVSKSKNIDSMIDINKVVKTIVFVNDKNEPVIVVLRSIYRVNQKKLAKILNVKDIRLATPEEVIKYTGYKVGGVAPFDINFKIYIDKELLNEDIVYTGGGDERHLLKIRVEDIIKNNNCEIIDIPKKSA
ncbi:MAG: YbaK/EbsC family protein [Nanopusillaceae archaeon]